MKYPGYQHAIRNVQANPNLNNSNLADGTSMNPMTDYGLNPQSQMPQGQAVPTIQYLTPEQSRALTQRWFPNGIPQGQFPNTVVEQVQGQMNAMQGQNIPPTRDMANKLAMQRMRNPQAAEARFRARNNGGELTERQKRRLEFLKQRRGK